MIYLTGFFFTKTFIKEKLKTSVFAYISDSVAG